MTTSRQDDELPDEVACEMDDVESLGDALFLGEVALMFGQLFLISDALWLHILFHLIATLFAIFVLRSAFHAAKIIPPSFPLQRPLGVTMYLAGHLLHFCHQGELSIGLAAALMVASPLAIMFLFEP